MNIRVKRVKKKKNSISKLWDSFKWLKIQVTGDQEGDRKENSQRIYSQKCFKFYENYTWTNPKSSTNLKHRKHEENCTKLHHKLLKTSNKENILTAARGEKRHITYRGTKGNGRKMRVAHHF